MKSVKKENILHKPIFEDSISASAINRVETKKVGNGGRAVSLNPRKMKVIPPPPLSGALNKRSIPTSEFRRFYDRGDLPIKVDH